MSTYEKRSNSLKEMMTSLAQEDICVAFSGGVDSSLILKMACDAARDTGKKVYAIMFHTMLHPSSEVEGAEKVAREMGADFKVLHMDELSHAGIGTNPPNRCYLCKKYLFESLQKEALKYGVNKVLEGTNKDDLQMYRPGIKAIKELGIISPLAQSGLEKKEVRQLSKELLISVADKPAAPCLATRFPYGTALSYGEMQKVESGEALLKKLELYNVRLRVHGNIARIEVEEGDMDKLMLHKKRIVTDLKALGYSFVTMDLEGFRSGSMDEEIEREGD